ncbi:hypothetical protein EDD21DRAFT_353285 [Dissophora ornata]|nr:hypothetical protein EDD21DRAFT_353285 [Dissophora ornata]
MRMGARVPYRLVRQVLYDRQPESFRKDRDVEKSVELWLSEIQKDSGKTMFLKNQHGDTNNFVIAWSTSFQLQVMVDNTDIACMDSTHKVVRKLHPAKDGTHVYESAFLFTLLVKDRFSKKGIPISFMICSNESHVSLCIFKKERDAMRPQLNAIRKATSADEQQRLWQQFQADYPSAPQLINYLQGWFTAEELPKWVVFHRECRPLSAYDERRRRRAQELDFDRALEMVALDMQESKASVKSFATASKEYTIGLDVAAKQLLSCTCTDFEKHQIACKHLYLVERVYEFFHIKHISDRTLPVSSRDRDIQQNGQQRSWRGSTVTAGDIDKDDQPLIPRFFPPFVREHMTLKRAREREEAKHKREDEDEKAFQDCETELAVLWTRIGDHLNKNKRSRACSLSYIQALAASMRKVCQDAESLYTTKIG